MEGDSFTFGCLVFKILAGFHLEMPTGNAHANIISSFKKKSNKMQIEHSYSFS